jgi:hypothetical protein
MFFPGQPDLGAFLLRVGGQLSLAGFYVTAGVTLIFTAWEYLEFKFRFWENWNPRSLPPVPQPIPPCRPPRPSAAMIGGVACSCG